MLSQGCAVLSNVANCEFYLVFLLFVLLSALDIGCIGLNMSFVSRQDQDENGF